MCLRVLHLVFPLHWKWRVSKGIFSQVQSETSPLDATKSYTGPLRDFKLREAKSLPPPTLPARFCFCLRSISFVFTRSFEASLHQRFRTRRNGCREGLVVQWCELVHLSSTQTDWLGCLQLSLSCCQRPVLEHVTCFNSQSACSDVTCAKKCSI